MKMYYTYLDYINMEVGLTKEDIEAICHTGSNDVAVSEICEKEYVKDQFYSVTDDRLISAAEKMTGDEVADREEALNVIIWTAAWDMYDDEDSDYNNCNV